MRKLFKLVRICLNLVIFGLAFAFLVSTNGKTIQANLFGTYVPQKGIIEDVFVVEKNAKRATDSKQNVELRVHYTVNNKSYNSDLLVQSFRHFEQEEATVFARKFAQKGDDITIYISPTSPEESVLNRIDEIHVWIYVLVFLVLFVLIFRIIWLVVGISKPLVPKTNKRGAPTTSPKTENKIEETPEISRKTEVTREEIKLEKDSFDALEMTGDSLADYYSGAVEKFKLAEYPGYYCTLFIMKNEVITVHQESTHNWTSNYNFKSFLENNELDKLLLEPDELINKDEIIAKIKTLINN
jgi:hypothetical protein